MRLKAILFRSIETALNGFHCIPTVLSENISSLLYLNDDAVTSFVPYIRRTICWRMKHLYLCKSVSVPIFTLICTYEDGNRGPGRMEHLMKEALCKLFLVPRQLVAQSWFKFPSPFRHEFARSLPRWLLKSHVQLALICVPGPGPPLFIPPTS